MLFTLGVDDAQIPTAITPRRLTWLKDELVKRRPKVVAVYGKVNWNLMRGLFNEVEFEPRSDGRFLVGRTGATVIALTSMFSNYTIGNAVIDDLCVAIVDQQTIDSR